MAWTAIIMGIGAGITYALTGVAKSQGEEWDWPKFWTTSIIGGLAGASVYFSGLSIADGYTFIGTLGITPVVQNLVTALWKRITYRKTLVPPTP